MTKQQAYNRIRKYFTRPGAELAKTGRGNECAYRLKNGKVRKCAVGCLIPNKLYSPSMENMDAYRVIANHPALKEYFEIADMMYDDRVDFFLDAQVAHDSSATVQGFLRKLDAAARKHGVKVAA